MDGVTGLSRSEIEERINALVAEVVRLCALLAILDVLQPAKKETTH